MRILLFCFLLLAGAAATKVKAAGGGIVVLTARGTVNPVLADYIERGIREAESAGATLLIIRLDTPGGLDGAMRDIVKAIVNADLPVAVYVSPAGARAASAGVFITVAAHIAAMAPSTSIGAASPIAIGPGAGEVSPTLSEKIVNDAAAYIRSLAGARGRNLEWAEKAVREAVSATGEEALSLNVIELVSPNLDDLISRLNGREVRLLSGKTVILNLLGARLSYIDMTGVEGFLHTLADPNIAYVLLSLAFLGIIVTIFNPALIFPAIIGGLAGLLAFYALGLLPVNYVGVLFILLAFGLLVAEVLTPGFGLFTAGGTISLVIGSLVLFKSRSPFLRVSPFLIAAVAALLLAAFLVIANQIVKTQKRQPTTGREELIGKVAVVRTPLAPEGLVSYQGEHWRAVIEGGTAATGEEVIIRKTEGLTLYVVKKEGNNA